MNQIKEKLTALACSKPALMASVATLTAAFTAVVPSFAAVGDVPASGVTDAVTAGLSLFSATVSTLTSNPIFLAILGCALIPVGFRVFKAAKNAVH